MKFPLIMLFLFFSLPAFAIPSDINIKWFENFNDRLLVDYICEALENNKDTLIARKNILKYRQEKNLNVSKELPYVSVGSDYLLLKVPQLAIPDNDIQTNSYALPFMTIWEVDYLGKQYDSIKKSRLDVENSILDLKSSRLIVASDLASAYFNVSNLNKQIELQEKILNLAKETKERKNKMFIRGVISKSELNNFEEKFLYEENVLDSIKKQREVFLTQIAYLTGKSPSYKEEIKITPFDEINYTGEYPECLKGDIVLNRPDIMKFENEMKKAKLDISIAKKDFLPSINVFGILTFSTILQNFNWNTAFAALSAGATQTLFHGGKRIFNLKKRKIEYDIALENYLKADINALKEINDTLFALKKDYKIFQNNKSRLNYAESNFVDVFKSYENGVKNYLDYMNENASYIKSESELQNSKNQNFINLLSLFKVTGGAL